MRSTQSKLHRITIARVVVGVRQPDGSVQDVSRSVESVECYGDAGGNVLELVLIPCPYIAEQVLGQAAETAS